MEGYDKPVKKARNILLVISAIQLFAGILIGSQEDGLTRIIVISLLAFISLIFFLLALWTKRKPYNAIITGLIIYSTLLITEAILDHSSLSTGLIFKVIVYLLLFSALSNARDVQRWKDSVKKN